MRIGVFDSGVGGKSVANAIEKAFPEDEVTFVYDKANFPYGTKSNKELVAVVTPILQELAADCDIIVVACNTVSTNIIEALRKVINVPLVAMEPMVKPAAELTQSKVIAVCATPSTLSSTRYKWLKETYAPSIKVVEPDCTDWSRMIEANQVEQGKIAEQMEAVCQQGADVIVLGCTHYHWIEDVINEVVRNRARVIQPEQAIVKRLKELIARQAPSS